MGTRRKSLGRDGRDREAMPAQQAQAALQQPAAEQPADTTVPRGVQLDQREMFSQRDTAQFGTKANPQASAEKQGGGGLALELQMQDGRTAEEKRRDEAKRNYDMFEQAPDAYERVKDLSAQRLQDGDFTDDEVTGQMWRYAAYNERGELEYRRELIDQEYDDLGYDIYRLGRDKPRQTEIDDARIRASTILAAYDQGGIKIDRAKRRRLERLATGDTVGEMEQIKDNRMIGPRSLGPKKHNAGYESAAAADGRAMLMELRQRGGLARKDRQTSKPLPQVKPQRKLFD